MLARGLKVERYVVESLVGIGGMAEVWSARHVVLGTRRALKHLVVTGSGSTDALVREGQVQARLDHPNILPVLDVLEHDGHTVLVLPLVEGPSLAQLLDHGPVPVPVAAALLLGVVAGMQAAHHKGVVHRDLKPANVLLDRRQGRVIPRVADFGIADDAHHSQRSSGTPRYTAPEARAGEPTDARADFFAFGVLCEDVFGDSVVPQALSRVVSGLKQARPADRLSDCSVIREALESIADTSSLDEDSELGRWVAHGFRGIGASSLHTAPTRARNPTEQTRPPQVTLPAYHNAFVGRDREREHVARALRDDRLVSLTGPGGVGKTRLAIAVGHDIAREYAGGVWFLDMSQAADAGGIARVAASALNIPLVGQKQNESAAVDAVATNLKSRPKTLLVVDNAEHIRRDAAQAVTTWLEAAPNLSVLCTSQVPLGVGGSFGERIVPIEPLCLPGSTTSGDAVALFVARAQQSDSPTVLGPDAQPFIRQIVQAVDGLPLAIELAAARVRVLGVQRLAERLSDQFRVLRTRGSDRPQRQRTLRAALDWSWALLDEHERHVVAQLSVFRGSFSLEAAEAIVAVDGADQWVDEIISSLVDKSWVRSWIPSGQSVPRLGLLRSIQAYAAEQLSDRAVEQRHGVHYTSLNTPDPADVFDVHGGAPLRAEWQQDIDNVVAATRRALARSEGPTASQGARLVWALTATTGPFGLGIELLTAAERLHPSVELWVDLACAHWRNGDIALAKGLFERALQAAETDGQVATVGSPYIGLLWATGALQASRDLLNRVVGITDGGAFARLRGVALSNGMVLDVMQGDADAGVVSGEAALALHRHVGDARSEARTSMNLGVLALRMGRPEQADEWLNQALSTHDAIGNRHGKAFTLGNLASLHLDAGDLEQALGYVRRALRLSQELGDGVALTRFSNYRARIHSRRGEAALAQSALDSSARFADQLDDDVLRGFQQVAAAWVAHDTQDWDVVDPCLARAEQFAVDQPEDGVIHSDIKAVRAASRT